MKNTNIVSGYKVFNPDWTCSPNGNTKQYSCPGNFEEDGELDICSHGMHFCEKLADCFKYYSFDPNNKIAEVIAYGDIIREGNKLCTNKLEIVRELSWYEVLDLVNVGEGCTGYGNTGNYNTGNYNTGNRNTGNYNTGNRNTGNYNTGNCNTGNYNTGNYNTGNCNTGNRNTGNYNTGNCNTGDYNIGNCNIGNHNIGRRNIGRRNIGDRNIGDYNLSSYNAGCFMTEEQKIMFFNKPSDWTYNDWIKSSANIILFSMPDKLKWIPVHNMSAKEKAAHPEYVTTGGYLKTVENLSELRQDWWNNLSNEEKDTIKSIPNFNADIFEQCTGIKVD